LASLLPLQVKALDDVVTHLRKNREAVRAAIDKDE
jgi:hypothetical protein